MNRSASDVGSARCSRLICAPLCSVLVGVKNRPISLAGIGTTRADRTNAAVCEAGVHGSLGTAARPLRTCVASGAAEVADRSAVRGAILEINLGALGRHLLILDQPRHSTTASNGLRIHRRIQRAGRSRRMN